MTNRDNSFEVFTTLFVVEGEDDPDEDFDEDDDVEDEDEDEAEDDDEDEDTETWQVFKSILGDTIPLKAGLRLTSGAGLPRLARSF